MKVKRAHKCAFRTVTHPIEKLIRLAARDRFQNPLVNSIPKRMADRLFARRAGLMPKA